MASAWDRVAERLVAERGDALLRYAYLLCGDRDEAADLVQDALVRTFGRPRLSLELPRAEAYVRRAILNLVIDRSRRRETWRRVRHLAVEPERAVVDADAVDARIDLAERLRTLSPRQSACLVLRYYEDLPVAEIARILGIAQGSVKRYLSDGLHALSSRMDAAAPAARTGGDHAHP
ncbi:sigma-70 family RNA polymerase sigma factor [Agromyces mediolanus]|uniref:sigma-70 family RNA polymerase sigma factor n=1 Tax=Agromyces mediolanus TaxID=41986 RepID=UPI003832E089